MHLQPVIQQYKSFIGEDYQLYFSPGRVNLIGEHIDYLGGRVFPTAISLGIYAIVSKRNDRVFAFVSHNFPKENPIIVDIDDLAYQKQRGWVNYPVGMIDAFVRHGMTLDTGLNIIIYGNLPNGAGLSSSASLEVLMGIVLEDQYSYPVDRIEMVQIAKQVENQYVGVNCGIMDQFAIGMSKRDHAIYLNTNTLDFELVPLRLGNHTIVIANSNVKRGLVDSKYNERRAECDQGLTIIQKTYPGRLHLCDVTIQEFSTVEANMPPNIAKRVRHAITEQARTIEAVQALRQDDLSTFGRILNQGHQSIRDDFEVSCLELDVLQASFVKHGAIGARMTGAGFGGCVIAIVPTNQIESIQIHVQNEYQIQTKRHADFYLCETHDGARKLSKEEWQ